MSGTLNLQEYGLTVAEVHRNLPPSSLYEHAMRHEKDASIAENGALVAYSGAKTGRSPKDIEDQITYPLSVALLSVPGADSVRGRSMFGSSFVQVTFKDGETLVGATQGYQPDRPGFFLTPADPKSNNERIFVVTKAVARVSFAP